MLLNFEKFTNYSTDFNYYMGLIDGEIGNLIDKSLHPVSENEVKQIIHKHFPKDWIVYGKYSTTLDLHSRYNYYNVCDLALCHLRDLQTHINNIEAMCDNSYQTLQDFDQFDITGL